MFQATHTAVTTIHSPQTVTPNTKEFRGGKFQVTIMHAQTFDDDALSVFGTGPQHPGAVVIQDIRGRTMGRASVERGRVEAWGGEYHWAGFDADLPWMPVSGMQPAEMQILVYHMNRTEKQMTFGRAVFNCLSFPDDSIYQCVFPIETIPDMMGNSSIVGSLCANIRYIGAPDAKTLRLGDKHLLSPQDEDDLTLRVSYEDKGYTKGGSFSLALLAHGRQGQFLYALDGKEGGANSPGQVGKGAAGEAPSAASGTRLRMRCVKPGEASRRSADPRHSEVEVTLTLSSIEPHISAFFLVLTADQQLTNLQDVQHISCEARNSTSGQAIARYDVQVRRPATSLMFARLVRVPGRGRGDDKVRGREMAAGGSSALCSV